MKRYIIIILLSACGIGSSKAQDRLGLEVKFVPYSLLKAVYASEDQIKVREYPQVGYYYQSWMTDRKYLYRKVAFQYFKMIDDAPITETRSDISVWQVYSSFGRGYYLRHREFEDDFSPYFSWGVGCGFFGAKEQTYMPGGAAKDPDVIPILGVAGFEFGFGFEKSLTRKWLLNASLEAHYQSNLFNPMYLGLTTRFLYRRY